MSKRLAGYDYSQPGFYFVTICTLQHRLEHRSSNRKCYSKLWRSVLNGHPL